MVSHSGGFRGNSLTLKPQKMQVDDFRTKNMPHRRPVVLPARLLVQRP